jgi:hypothetical protein
MYPFTFTQFHSSTHPLTFFHIHSHIHTPPQGITSIVLDDLVCNRDGAGISNLSGPSLLDEFQDFTLETPENKKRTLTLAFQLREIMNFSIVKARPFGWEDGRWTMLIRRRLEQVRIGITVNQITASVNTIRASRLQSNCRTIAER